MTERVLQGWLVVVLAANLAAADAELSRLPGFVMGKSIDENLPVYA